MVRVKGKLTRSDILPERRQNAKRNKERSKFKKRNKRDKPEKNMIQDSASTRINGSRAIAGRSREPAAF